ncbi:MAG: RnfABCDGE type electron transport complex subunit C, partial [Defluviitaleaceae bacterium]|nr:RnfABCDGE type electron transport complex subunit C [Defluviitaleaceae bacterium]
QGSEKQLIQAVTGREVPSGKLPIDVGCLVENITTLAAIDRAVYRGRPLMRRVVTLSGGAFNKCGNYEVRLGMNYRSMIEAAGGFREEPTKIISGGPMMGAAMFDLNVPVTKTCGAVLAFTKKEAEILEQQPCIRCGRCIDHCPMDLMPLELNFFAVSNNPGNFFKYHGKDCIECGTCSYVCPAKRHLSQSIRVAKRSFKEN